MSFTDNFKQIENIKTNYSTKYLKQEIMMKEYLKNISKAAVDSEVINKTFSDLVAPYLSKSDFNIFSKVVIDDEIAFVTDAIGHGDIFSFKYGDKKQIDTIVYQNSDKLISVKLKVKDDKAYVTRVVKLDDRILETKSTFRKTEDDYYQDSYVNKLATKEDDLTTYAKEQYKYNLEEDKLEKSFNVVTKENDKIISKSMINSVIDQSDYVIEDGRFYTINKKTEQNKMKKCKKIENELVKSFN